MVTDQTKGEKESGPQTNHEEKDLIYQLNNASISAKTMIEIMQHAVAKCTKVCISAHGLQIPSLLDSGSKVTLLQQLYFNKHILPKIKLTTGEKANTHNLFKLTVANDGQMPIKMYTELDITFWGLKVPNVGMLIAEEPNQVLDKKQCVCSKIWATGFNSLMCPEGVNPLLFSQLYIFYHSNIWKNNILGATSEVMFQNIESSKSPKTDDLSKRKD